MKCLRCNRTLARPNPLGLGSTCARKRQFENAQTTLTVRVEILYSSPAERRYLVFSETRRRVLVYQNAAGRTADCDCQPEIWCEHIEAVAPIDRAKFPDIEVTQ